MKFDYYFIYSINLICQYDRVAPKDIEPVQERHSLYKGASLNTYTTKITL